jgi:hypothetical protein
LLTKSHKRSVKIGAPYFSSSCDYDPSTLLAVVKERWHRSVDEDGFRTVQIKSNKAKGWKPVKKTTLDFIEKTVKSVARYALCFIVV